MTYCVGLLMDAGLVMLSDTRTNAGVDQINTYSKMTVFERPDDRVIVLMSAGNLAITQATVSRLKERLRSDGESLWRVPNMFEAARHVGDCLRAVNAYDGPHLSRFNIDFNATFILGGQIMGERPRLFNIYAAGNYVEATLDTPYFQIGESKYGKPIIDRIFNWQSSLAVATKCALVSMDSTLKSNLSVGLPLDLLLYRRDAFEVDTRLRIEAGNPYFTDLGRQWGDRIRQAFIDMPELPLAGRGQAPGAP